MTIEDLNHIEEEMNKIKGSCDKLLDMIRREKENYLDLKCAICGAEDTLHIDDIEGWMTELYLGERCLGDMVCPECVDKHCEEDTENVVCSLKLHTVDFTKVETRPLLNRIMEVFNDESDM